MPKTKKNESVLHDWVHALPFQMQALLMTAMRGPDGLPKECYAKHMVRYLRGAVLKPAGNWSGLNDNSFMWGDWDAFFVSASAFSLDCDAVPHHFLMHLVHAAEVLAYEYPNNSIADMWLVFYEDICERLHMNPETKKQMRKRLNDFGCGVQ